MMMIYAFSKSNFVFIASLIVIQSVVTTNSSQPVNAKTSKKELPSRYYKPTNQIELRNIAYEVSFTSYENLIETTSSPDTSTTVTSTSGSSNREERTTKSTLKPPYFYRHLDGNNLNSISSTSTAIPQISPTSSKVDRSKVIHPTTESPLKKSKSIPKPIPQTPVQYGGAKPKSHENVHLLPTILDDNHLYIPRPYHYQDLYPYPYLDFKQSNSRYENSNRRMEEIYQMSHPDKYAGQVHQKQTHLTDSEKLVHSIMNSEPAVKKEMVMKILELYLQNQANQKQVFMQATPTPQFQPFYS